MAENKLLKSEDVQADVDLPKDVVITKSTPNPLAGIVGSKKTFKSITNPLTTILSNLKQLVSERSASIKDKKYKQAQLDLEIQEDMNEISESETTIEFIEQVIKGIKK